MLDDVMEQLLLAGEVMPKLRSLLLAALLIRSTRAPP